MKIFLNIVKIVLALIFLLIITYIVLIYGFHWNPLMQGLNEELKSVSESKKYGVFFAEYYCPNGQVNFANEHKLEIKETWVEYGWGYNLWSKPTIFHDGTFILYFVFKETSDYYFAEKFGCKFSVWSLKRSN